MQTAQCNRCRQTLPTNAFTADRLAYTDPRLRICMTCDAARATLMNKSHPQASRRQQRLSLMENGESVCGLCGTIKTLTEFPANKSRANGYSAHCKKCSNQRRAQRKLEHQAEREAAARIDHSKGATP